MNGRKFGDEKAARVCRRNHRCNSSWGHDSATADLEGNG